MCFFLFFKKKDDKTFLIFIIFASISIRICRNILISYYSKNKKNFFLMFKYSYRLIYNLNNTIRYIYHIIQIIFALRKSNTHWNSFSCSDIIVIIYQGITLAITLSTIMMNTLLNVSIVAARHIAVYYDNQDKHCENCIGMIKCYYSKLLAVYYRRCCWGKSDRSYDSFWVNQCSIFYCWLFWWQLDRSLKLSLVNSD